MPKPVFEGNGSGMHCHQSIWKDGKPLFAGDGYGGFSQLGAPLRGRHPQALPRAGRLHESDHELVQAAHARLRGSGQAGPVQPEPIGGLPHPDVLAEPQGQADRGALPRPELQPLPGLQRHADGGHRRDREQDRSRASPSTRTSTGCRRKRRPTSRACREASKRPSSCLEKTTPSC